MDKDENRRTHFLSREQQLRVVYPYRCESTEWRHNLEGVPRVFPQKTRVQRQIRREPRRKKTQGTTKGHKRQ